MARRWTQKELLTMGLVDEVVELKDVVGRATEIGLREGVKIAPGSWGGIKVCSRSSAIEFTVYTLFPTTVSHNAPVNIYMYIERKRADSLYIPTARRLSCRSCRIAILSPAALTACRGQGFLGQSRQGKGEIVIKVKVIVVFT